MPDHPDGASRIPKFQSREEEAGFWDTHDVTAYLGELRPVEAPFAPGLSSGLLIRLHRADWEALGRIAAESGTDHATLARTWIKERWGRPERDPGLIRGPAFATLRAPC